ncbi:type IV secretion system DNA-binding domain-containing protein [Candidatus Parcubacteria bacterium]|nr:type IV secretion system DNA-binding domain-containing protein [Candidatus Parcubacteria bacterium]
MYNPEKITYFAETDSRNKRVAFGIKAKDRLKHVYVIGKTGMGKSTLLENMAVQDIKGNEGMAFIDPHGKTAELLLEYVPPERIKDVIYFAPFDTEYPISFNVMEDVGIDKRHLVANGLMSAFKKIWVDAWSARMEYILNNILLALLEYPGSTLIGVNRMLSDKTYRDKIVENVKDPSVKSFWVDEFAKYGEKYMQEAGAAIQNKIGQFISNPLVRNIIGQERSSFDIRKLMDDGKIMIINLSKGRVGEANANLIGSMLITKIYLAAMSRADKADAELQKLPNFYLYVDEFQSFANESFADILSEARKYKLNLTIAHQYIEQMEEEVRAAVFGNVGTMITFRVGAYDAEVLEKEFAPTFTAEDLVNLGSYQIYLKLMIDGIGSQPFSARTLAPIEKPSASSVEEIVRNSRRVYAEPKLEVEKKIQAWHEEGRMAKPEKKPERKYEPRAVERRADERRTDERRTYAPKPAYVPKPQPPREPMPSSDDFKPLKSISLDALKQKSDNQRPQSQKNVSELRNALSSIVKNTPVPAPSNQTNSRALPASGLRRDSNSPDSSPPKKNGPSPEELKALLDA